MDLEWGVLALLVMAAGFAGFVDSVVGGGGLVQIPALFTVFPQASPATIFGTNKIAAIAGTATASIQYARKVSLEWSVLAPAFVATLIGAWSGARVVAWLPKDAVRPAVLVALIAVAIYTFMKKDFGRMQTRRGSGRRRTLLGLAAGAGIGFYDGFFGPGTGTFFIFAFVRWLGDDFLHASAKAKVLNFASNLAALAYFVPAGHVIWKVALAMAVANIAGAFLGSRMAIGQGSGFVRKVFGVVLVATISKFAYDTGHLQGWW